MVGAFDDELVGDSVGLSVVSEFGNGASDETVVGDTVGSSVGSSVRMFCEGAAVVLGVGVSDSVGCPKS